MNLKDLLKVDAKKLQEGLSKIDTDAIIDNVKKIDSDIISSSIRNMNLNDVKEKIGDINLLHEESEQFFTDIKDIWTTQQISDIVSGNLIIPYSTINKYVAINLKDGGIQNINFSYEDELLVCKAERESDGKVCFKGEFTEFIHNNLSSYFEYRICEKKFLDKNWFDNLIINVGIWIMSNIWGGLSKDWNGINSKLTGNNLHVDFREFIEKSEWKQKKLLGKSIVDIVQISAVIPKGDGLLIKTNLNATKEMLELMKLYGGSNTLSIMGVAAKCLSQK